jgi:tetratricopeptide (TPR) repeat protein
MSMAKSKKEALNKEDPDFEIKFLEGVLKVSPNFTEALVNLGDLYTKQGFYEKGLSVDLKLAMLKPEDPIVLYNLACSYSLIQDVEKSLKVMKAAVQKGYSDLGYLEQDADLINLRQFSAFKSFLAEIKTKTKTSLLKE